jgi:hypothetical protein
MIASHKAISLYDSLFVGGASEEDIKVFRRMFWSSLDKPITLPTSPPGGWLNFNNKFGGLPWYNRFSPYSY